MGRTPSAARSSTRREGPDDGDGSIGLQFPARLPPNGSRLSCGPSARGRKKLEQQKQRLAREAEQFLLTCERPAASSAWWAPPARGTIAHLGSDEPGC